MNILIAEDNEASRYLLLKSLGAAGHRMVGVADGMSALAACRNGPRPDLLISDALMPEMDGFRLCQVIRRDPELFNLPFILYTATFTDQSDEQFALSIGVDRFVIKPVLPEELLTIIGEVMAAVAARPGRILGGPEDDAMLSRYTQTLSVKLEEKVTELKSANTLLETSQASIRDLNTRLQDTVRRLEVEVADRMRTEEFLQLAQTVASIGSWQVDPRTGFILWTDEARRLLDITQAAPAPIELLLAGVERVHHAAVRALVSPDAPVGGESHEFGDFEFNHTSSPSGRVRRLHLRSRFVRFPTSDKAVRIGTLQDVTERHEAAERRKALEYQLFRSQKMESLGTLAGGIAHDFNNILTAILGHAEILKMEMAAERDHPEWYQSAVEIANAAERSRETILQILTFSRRQSAERKPVRFAQVIEEGIRLLRSTLDKRIHLTVDLASDRLVLANESQIHQIILNLCTNAAYAMREKGGSLAVSLNSIDLRSPIGGPLAGRTEGRSGPHVCLRVADTGMGINNAILDQIFDPFFTTKPTGEGTGLGLAVVHGIVRAHEGSISVESVPGRGTTFTVFLPAVAAGVGQPDKSPGALSAALDNSGGGRRILVVDDEPSVARVCAQFLARLGYRPTALTDAMEAKALFEADPRAFDAIITDFLMPSMTGIELAHAFKAVRPSVPILMVAGYGGQFEAARAKAEGIHEILAKPFSITSLADALGRTFG